MESCILWRNFSILISVQSVVSLEKKKSKLQYAKACNLKKKLIISKNSALLSRKGVSFKALVLLKTLKKTHVSVSDYIYIMYLTRHDSS